MSLVFTQEHLQLPGLYAEQPSEDDGDEGSSCYCSDCQTPPVNELSRFEISHLYHRFISSLRVAPIFRAYQVSHGLIHGHININALRRGKRG